MKTHGWMPFLIFAFHCGLADASTLSRASLPAKTLVSCDGFTALGRARQIEALTSEIKISSEDLNAITDLAKTVGTQNWSTRESYNLQNKVSDVVENITEGLMAKISAPKARPDFQFANLKFDHPVSRSMATDGFVHGFEEVSLTKKVVRVETDSETKLGFVQQDLKGGRLLLRLQDGSEELINIELVNGRTSLEGRPVSSISFATIPNEAVQAFREKIAAMAEAETARSGVRNAIQSYVEEVVHLIVQSNAAPSRSPKETIAAILQKRVQNGNHQVEYKYVVPGAGVKTNWGTSVDKNTPGAVRVLLISAAEADLIPVGTRMIDLRGNVSIAGARKIGLEWKGLESNVIRENAVGHEIENRGFMIVGISPDSVELKKPDAAEIVKAMGQYQEELRRLQNSPPAPSRLPAR